MLVWIVVVYAIFFVWDVVARKYSHRFQPSRPFEILANELIEMFKFLGEHLYGILKSVWNWITSLILDDIVVTAKHHSIIIGKYLTAPWYFVVGYFNLEWNPNYRMATRIVGFCIFMYIVGFYLNYAWKTVLFCIALTNFIGYVIYLFTSSNNDSTSPAVPNLPEHEAGSDEDSGSGRRVLRSRGHTRFQ